MTSEMRIDVKWLPPFRGPEEVGFTSAEIRISFGDENATRFEDAWSQSIQQSARVSAYPLALWLASSWWRIRWEPFPSRVQLSRDGMAADSDWRMGHELTAAGYGFIWPQLAFASDGESILARCRRSAALSDEPVRFLSDFEASVPAHEFEGVIGDFINLVLRRLDGFGETQLHRVWQEVLTERIDPEQSAARRLEARLGHEADEAPWQLLERFLGLVSEAGADATDEIAPVCAGKDALGTLEKVKDLALLPGISGRSLVPAVGRCQEGSVPPWERGRRLANSVRNALGLGAEPMTDHALANLLDVPPQYLNSHDVARAPIGLAIRGADNVNLKLLFRKRSRAARRFEAARFIGDHLCAGNHDRWLPVSDASTARQKVQRAFAAEFLCPIESLRDYLGSEFSPEAFEDASEHFGISEMAVKSHLANHHLIPRALVDSESIL